jgi:hypothetical protein
MSRKYKILCSIAGLIIVASIACMIFLDGVRDQPNPAGILLLVVGIVFWAFILARGFGMYDPDDEEGDEGDGDGQLDTSSEVETRPGNIDSPPSPQAPKPPPPPP